MSTFLGVVLTFGFDLKDVHRKIFRRVLAALCAVVVGLYLQVGFVWAQGSLTADVSESENSLLCISESECRISYEFLTDQNSDPFLFSGYLLTEEAARWKQYERYLRKFPSVQDCLVPEEQVSDNPNLLRIDWKLTGMQSGAEVCLFRIARSLGNVDRLRQWLEYHDFLLSPKNRIYSGEGSGDKVVSNFSAYWTTEQYRLHNPSWIRALTGFDLALHYEIVFQFSEVERVVGVSVVIPSL